LASRKIKIRDVFKSLGQPTITYVERDEGLYERQLISALNSKGKLCLITGPSKTGKTTLYKRILKRRQLEPLIVRCDIGLTMNEFWTKALEKINFERLSSIQDSTENKILLGSKVGGKIGWAWLANIIGEDL